MSGDFYRIRLAGGEVEFACPPDDTLLRAAQRAGLGFPYECNVGCCGNCKFELVQGDVATAWAQAPGLSDKDRQRQRHLGCQSSPLSDCVVKLRPAERYVPPHRPQRVVALLRAQRAITHDIAEFHFELASAVPFEPGQYALVQLPGVAGPRAYSMSNTSADGGAKSWHFQVRQVHQAGGVGVGGSGSGSGSEALFALRPGAAVHIDGPYGMAWLRRDAPRDMLCLAGGSGLAPMLSIARGAMTEPRLAERQLHFIYGGRTPADLCGRDMLQVLPGWGTRLSYRAFVSAPAAEGMAGAAGAAHEAADYGHGFVHEAALALHGERLRAMEVYFAGPPAMATAVQRMLLDAGVPPDQQHFDQFY